MTWLMSCFAFAMFDCVAMAVINRDFRAVDSDVLEDEGGRGVPDGKVGLGGGDEEDLSDPPKNPPKDMLGWWWERRWMVEEAGLDAQRSWLAAVNVVGKVFGRRWCFRGRLCGLDELWKFRGFVSSILRSGDDF